MEKLTWSTAIPYYIIYGLCYALSLLPFRLLYLLSDLLYPLVYYIVRYRRKVVRDNLTGSFPEKSRKDIIHIEKRFYHFFCDYVVETIKLASISEQDMKERMIFHGTKEMKRACEEKHVNFAFLYLGHYCNWEWIASLALNLPMHGAQIYHPLYNKAMDRFFLKLREQFGGECIPMKSTLRRVVELKRAKQPTAIGFISDQLPKWNSIHFFVPFLHRETAVFTGAEQMGRQVGAVYFYADIVRPRRGYYECTLKRLEVPATPVTDYDMTTRFTQELERSIQAAPEFWLWSHKRWKRTKEEWLERQRKNQ